MRNNINNKIKLALTLALALLNQPLEATSSRILTPEQQEEAYDAILNNELLVGTDLNKAHLEIRYLQNNLNPYIDHQFSFDRIFIQNSIRRALTLAKKQPELILKTDNTKHRNILMYATTLDSIAVCRYNTKINS